jgi:F-type H+-transporting ATPase subunit delta
MLNPSSRAARVYAEALIAIGTEQGLMPRIYDELKSLAKLYDEDREFRGFFTSPRLDPAKKYAAIEKALGDELCKPMLGLLKVMIQKGRELLLDNVADQFERFKDLAEGKVHVHVGTARPLGDDQKQRIAVKVEELMGKQPILHEHVQPELLGGTIVRVGDYVVDGTLKRKLRALRKSLVAKERMFE